MCLFRRFALILTLGVAVCSTEVSAQDLIGTSGLINIPTADMQPDGTFDGGARWMSPAAQHDLVNYDTGLYYVRFTPFSFFEFTFRETLFKTQHSVKKTWNYYQQDRSSTIRVRPLAEREGKWWPSVVIGVNDIYSAYGASFYAGYYGVATKHFQLGDGQIAFTAGYFRSFKFGKMYNGAFGGVEYCPLQRVPLRIMADYDTKGVNVGVGYTVFRHIRTFAFTHRLKGWGVGLSYRTTIKF